LAHVLLSGTLKQLAGGESEIEIEARDVRQLLRALGERYPEFAPIRSDSEVHLVPAIRGG
jgi:molybdopterin synthase sulfur carrier subunit